METIENINFKGRKALIRVDFNVPLNEAFEITDNTRITAALPTINKILNDGGAVILMSHLGRPKEGYENKFSLAHLVDPLSELLESKIHFAKDCVGKIPQRKSDHLKSGEVLLLENLRFHKGETKGEEEFAKQLSGLGDCYVNDAFGTAHRAHASTTIVAKFFPENKFFGNLMINEIESLNKVLNNPQQPFTAIIGGAKVSDKIIIIENLLKKVDNLLIGGAMAYTFVKALGGSTGKSLVEDDSLSVASNLINIANENNITLLLPDDSIIADEFSKDANIRNSISSEIPAGWMGLDIGQKSIKQFSEIINKSSTILWNGPMGVFEFENFQNGTKEIAQAISDATAKGAYSLIGGGDSVSAIKKFGFKDKVSYISTGGGAMLEYLEGKKLPGIKAIMD